MPDAREKLQLQLVVCRLSVEVGGDVSGNRLF